MTDKLFFVSGLPRSGSTLLMNVLGQNPAHHVTPTSGLIELFISLANNWPNYVEFKAEGLEKVKPRVLGSMKGVLGGFFEKELAEGRVVFDKSRGWLQYIETLEEALGRNIKVLVTVRDVRAIVASFEKLYRNRSIDYRMPVGEAYLQAQTIEGRAQVLLGPGGVAGITINRLRDALLRGVGDRLAIIPYQALTGQPKQTMSLLHQVLDLPPFEYDPDNVQQVTEENDTYHGMNLHDIRPKIEPQSAIPWEGILPDALCNELAQAYTDINRLCVVPQQAPTPVQSACCNEAADCNGSTKHNTSPALVGVGSDS